MVTVPTRDGILKLKGMTRSLSTKMSLIAALTMFLCTMTSVGVFLVGNFRQSVEAEQARLQSVASIFGAVLSKPVAAGDADGARDALRAMRDLPSILQISVHDAKGHLLAEMGGGAVLERSVLRSDKVSLGDLFSIETMEIRKPVIDGGWTVGTLELTVDISWMAHMFWQRFFAAGLFAASAIAVGFFIGQRLVKRATRPLSQLAGALAGIGGTETLAYNFKRASDDEVGVLIDAFNDMMGRIGERDKALRAHSDSLEDTVQKRTSELVAARDDAERANAAKSEFLSMMSHEIRTPMNGMMVMAQMLAAAPLSPRHLRFAEIINRSGQNLLAIINDVLDISKIEAGRLDLEANPFSLDELFADVYGLFNERARDRDVHLGYAVDPSVPLTLIGDATRLNQVITNLVNNALKFTEKGSVILRAKAKKTAAGFKVAISVSDTGIGIAKDKLDLVFDRFSQADQTITRRFGGTGLGLAISKRLVEAMDGNIGVTSLEGKGSTFTAEVLLQAEPEADTAVVFAGTIVRIDCASPIDAELLSKTLRKHGAVVSDDNCRTQPSLVLTDRENQPTAASQTSLFLVPALGINETSYRTRGRLEFSVPASRDAIAKLAKAAASGDFAVFRNLARAAEQLHNYDTFRGLRALAVDDNNVNREVLNEALTSMGMKVDSAVNGEDALRFAEANVYDVIFMDCSMPVMDGYTATRILREREKETGRRTAVVAITALSEGTGDKGWRANGMDGWISKPFTIPSIAARVSDLVLGGKPPAGSADAVVDQYGTVPLLDEPTIAMISRLSSGNASGAARRIHELLASTARTALEGLKSAAAAADLETQAECLQSLQSASRSAGALRLAAAAGDFVKNAKGGRGVDKVQRAMLHELFKHTSRDLASRLGLGPETKAG
jgi:signal transduction histidine kinase/DNA-binding NarL/FixJ family response regulator